MSADRPSPQVINKNGVIMTEASETQTVPNGYTAETLAAKAKQPDGTTKEYSYTVAKPTTAKLAELLTEGGDIAAMLTDACFNGVKQAARNMAVRDLLAGITLVMPDDLLRISLDMAANRANNGEALVLQRELQALVIEVANAASISSAGITKIRKLISSAAGLALAANPLKAKVQKLLEATASSMDDTTITRLSTPLNNLLEACTPASEEDFDF